MLATLQWEESSNETFIQSLHWQARQFITQASRNKRLTRASRLLIELKHHSGHHHHHHCQLEETLSGWWSIEPLIGMRDWLLHRTSLQFQRMLCMFLLPKTLWTLYYDVGHQSSRWSNVPIHIHTTECIICMIGMLISWPNRSFPWLRNPFQIVTLLKQQDRAPCHTEKEYDKSGLNPLSDIAVCPVSDMTASWDQDTWPLSSPDLNLLDYSVWARVGGSSARHHTAGEDSRVEYWRNHGQRCMVLMFMWLCLWKCSMHNLRGMTLCCWRKYLSSH